MKITKRMLKQVIRDELNYVLRERQGRYERAPYVGSETGQGPRGDDSMRPSPEGYEPGTYIGPRGIEDPELGYTPGEGEAGGQTDPATFKRVKKLVDAAQDLVQGADIVTNYTEDLELAIKAGKAGAQSATYVSSIQGVLGQIDRDIAKVRAALASL